MKTATAIAAIALVCVAAFGVLSGREWQASHQTEAEMRANADLRIADIQAQAQMHAADQAAASSIEESRQATQRTAMWTQVAPIVALIVVVGVGAWIVLWWRGRAHLVRVERGGGDYLPLPPAPPREVVVLAQARGGTPLLVAGVWHIERDGQLIARLRELPDKGSRM